MTSVALREHESATEVGAAARLAPADDVRLRNMLAADYDFIWRLLRRFGLRDDVAEDAAQQVFMIAARRLDEVKVGSERSFLFGTAMRVASDIRRSAAYRREVAHENPAEHLVSDHQPDELLDRERARRMLDRVLDTMDEELRTVFVLYELEEMTTLEIATLLGIPHGTAASRLRRGREQFQSRVEKIQRTGGRT